MSSDNTPNESTGLQVALPAVLMIGALVFLLVILLGSAGSNSDSELESTANAPTATATVVVLAESSTPRPATSTPTPIVLPGASNASEATSTPTPLVIPTQADETQEAEVVEPTATDVPQEPTAEAGTGSDDSSDVAAVEGDPERGQEIFNTFQTMANFACSNCHLVDSESMLIGPGLLNIGQRAATREDGLSATDYIRQSILEPNAYVVEGYTANLMPQNFADIFTEQDLSDLIAYLMTLRG